MRIGNLAATNIINAGLVSILYFSTILGYGFVDFENPSDAMKAVHYLQSMGISVQFAKLPLVSLNDIHSPLWVETHNLGGESVVMLVG